MQLVIALLLVLIVVLVVSNLIPWWILCNVEVVILYVGFDKDDAVLPSGNNCDDRAYSYSYLIAGVIVISSCTYTELRWQQCWQTESDYIAKNTQPKKRTYQRMDEGDSPIGKKWRLPSGTLVEDAMYKVGLSCQYEQ